MVSMIFTRAHLHEFLSSDSSSFRSLLYCVIRHSSRHPIEFMEVFIVEPKMEGLAPLVHEDLSVTNMNTTTIYFDSLQAPIGIRTYMDTVRKPY